MVSKGRFKAIHNELEVYRVNGDRKLLFNAEIYRILKYYKPSTLTDLPIFEGDLLLYDNLLVMMDRKGKHYELFDKVANSFKAIPTKEFLLLLTVALGLNDFIDQILGAAAYAPYVKNLPEFIIYVGLKNKRSIDDIRNKLIDYGYRGDWAIDYEYNASTEATPNSRANFRTLVGHYAKAKGKTIKAIIKEAGFVSDRYDASKNKYYTEAFSGSGKMPVRLTNDQVMRLFRVMGLTQEEQLHFADQLIGGSFLIDGEEAYIVDLIEDGIGLGPNLGHDSEPGPGSQHTDSLVQPTRNSAAYEMAATDVSINTTFIHKTIENIDWSNIDRFIHSNFGTIRSFALFFDQVLAYENLNLRTLCLRTSLPDSALYEYKSGLTVPEIYRLSVIASLLPHINTYIYFTLLKKAGKFEFGEKTDSPLIMMVLELIKDKNEPRLIFGDLFDAIESILDENLINSYEELAKAYRFQCEIILRHLKKTLITLADFKPFYISVHQALAQAQNPKVGQVPMLSQIFIDARRVLKPATQQVLANTLKDTYAFSSESPILSLVYQFTDSNLEV